MTDFQTKPTHSRFQDITGKVFGRLVVVSYHRKIKQNHYWLCQCCCGEVKSIRSGSLKSGFSESCGCLFRELSSKRNSTHGGTRRNGIITPEYLAWAQMKSRVYNKKLDGYKNYGGRGVTICDRWLKFENFIADMGKKPSPKHSIDRKDNNGNYEPDNCRWATRKEQARNKRNNHIIVYGEESMTVVQWAERIGVSNYALYNRIRLGWPIEDILNKPLDRKNR